MESNGRIELTFFNNNLEVRGDFFPPQEGNPSFSSDYVTTLLEKNRIVYGINHEEINLALQKCINDGETVTDVLVARGDLPVNEVPEYMQFNPFLSQGSGQIPEEETMEGNIDHRTRSPFVIVKKDMALAKIKHRKAGQDGRNVFGEIVAHKIVKPEEVFAGENTRMEGRFLLSNINGQLVVSKKQINVRDSLIIKGPVGYGTGNIIFPGDVQIEGPVSDGFKIYSGGSVTIKQTLDVTDVITKGDLSVAGGIIGRGMAMVKVGGSLHTKFIENCRVACRKSIVADTEIINSHVFTLETLEMGDNGQIVGGEIYALKGLRTGGIGKKTGKAARIHCGIDFTLDQEREKTNGVLRILAAKLSRLRDLMEDPHTEGEKREKMEELCRRLEEEQQKAQAKVSDLLGRLNTNWDATVEAKGEIVPGTLIEICQVALYVTTPLKKVRIWLDRRSNKLIVQN